MRPKRLRANVPARVFARQSSWSTLLPRVFGKRMYCTRGRHCLSWFGAFSLGHNSRSLRMSKLIRFKPLTALAFTGLTVVALTSACSSKDNPLAAAQHGLCCKTFSVAADNTGATFGLEGEFAPQFRTL